MPYPTRLVSDLAAAPLDDLDADALRAALALVPTYDEVSVSARCAQLWSRSIKNSSQQAALDLALACVDLTTLEGTDTDARVATLAQKAAHPDHNDPSCPRPAAVCVHPDLVGAARTALDAAGAAEVAVAAVATGFPAGRTSVAVKLIEVELALSLGATEVDIVIDRAALLAGDERTVFAEVASAARACHAAGARLKTILETGELGSLDMIARAAAIATWAGSDFVKTSTGKIPVGATPTSTYVLLDTVRRHAEATGTQVGVKAAGGIRSAKDAVRYLVLVAEHAGSEWCDPTWWRFGASTLANDLVAQRAHLRLGRYLGPEHFTLT